MIISPLLFSFLLLFPVSPDCFDPGRASGIFYRPDPGELPLLTKQKTGALIQSSRANG